MNREDIHIVARNSNLSEIEVNHALKDKIYNNAESWQKFLRLLFLSLGAGLTVSGIVFFFAYNWVDLHKFAKMGIIASLIVLSTLSTLLPQFNRTTKNIILTAVSILVGVLFAVFGQVYQTGANAYDFFLGWTVFISLWVIVANFPPLWLIYIALINTTFILYSQQVAYEWSGMLISMVLFIMNSIFLIGFILLSQWKLKIKVPFWLLYIIALAAVSFSTKGIIQGIYYEYDGYQFWLFVLIVIALYSIGIKYGLKEKSGFYLTVIPFSLIIIITALLVNLSMDVGMFLFISLFILISVTLVIANLINLQKKWKNEE
jgi:uncharacterized membrane protein